MSYKLLETFKQYTGNSDYIQGWESVRGFLSGTYDLIVRPAPAGPFGKYATVFGAGTGSQVTHINFYKKSIDQEFNDLAISFDFKLGGASYSATSFYHLNDKRTADFVPVNNTQHALAILSIEIVSRVPRVYHSIITNFNPSTQTHNSNKLLLGEFSTLVGGESYTMQIRGRITEIDGQKIGQATIILNGETMNVEFDPNRVTPLAGYEQNGFQTFSTASVRSSTSVNNETLISDLTFYTPDSETPFPMGPVDLQTLMTPNANLSVGPVNESTFVTISEEMEFDLEDPVGEILGASIMTRANALGGNVPIGFEIDLVNGEQATRVFEKDIAPGFAAVMDTKLIDKSMINAGTKIRARSVVR